MKKSWFIFASLVIALSVHAQTTPPPGIVIPFDEEDSTDAKSTKSPKNKTASKRKASSRTPEVKDKSIVETPSFLKTAKPRSNTASKKNASNPGPSPAPGKKIRTQKTEPKPSVQESTDIRVKRSSAKRKKAKRNKAKRKKAKRKKAKRKKAKRNKAKRNKAKRKKVKRKKAKRNNTKRKKADLTPPKEKRTQSPRQKQASAVSNTPNHDGLSISKRRRKALSGKGLLETFDSPFGRLGTVSQHRAEVVRSQLKGRTEVDDNDLLFSLGSYQIKRRYNSRLAALADYINATPSVLVVFVVGHADDSTSPAESALLSSARSSAVSEALVERGVSAKRLLAFGVDRHFPVSVKPAENRRVHFEFIHKKTPLMAASSLLSTASVVRFSGLGSVKKDKGTRGLKAPMVLSSGNEVSITSGEAALVLPSGRLLTLNGGTQLRIEEVYSHMDSDQGSEILRLNNGSLRISPPTSIVKKSEGSRRPQIDLILRGFGYQVEFSEASGSINAQDENLVLSLDSGRVRIQLNGGPSIFLTGGQSLVKDSAGIAVHRRLTQPIRVSPPPNKAKTQLTWLPVPDAVSYVIEVSSRIGFDWNIKQYESSLPIFDIETLSSRGEWYLRIHAIDQFGTMGEPSQIIVGSGKQTQN